MVYLLQSGWWINLGTVIISVFSLLLYMVFARILPPEVYGTYQYLLSGAALIGALTLSGMNNAIARAVARGNDRTLYSANWTQARWSIVPFSIALIVAFYYYLHGTTTLFIGFLCIGFLTPFISIFGTYASFLQGKQDFRHGFWYGMGWNVPYYIGLIIVSYLYPSTIALLFTSLGIQAAAQGIAYYRTIRAYRPQEESDESSIRYGKHLSVLSFGTVVATQIDTIVAFHFLGPAAVALYSFATAIPERLAGFFKFIPTAALPRFSNKSSMEIRGAFGRRVWYAIFSMFIFVLIYIFAAHSIFSLLFPTYTDAVPYSQVYSLIIVSSIAGLFTSALTAQQNIKELYAYTIGVPIAQIALQTIGIIMYGLWGLIIARLVSQSLAAAFAFILLFRKKES